MHVQVHDNTALQRLVLAREDVSYMLRKRHFFLEPVSYRIFVWEPCCFYFATFDSQGNIYIYIIIYIYILTYMHWIYTCIYRHLYIKWCMLHCATFIYNQTTSAMSTMSGIASGALRKAMLRKEPRWQEVGLENLLAEACCVHFPDAPSKNPIYNDINNYGHDILPLYCIYVYV